jgi:hypothetical protein
LDAPPAPPNPAGIDKVAYSVNVPGEFSVTKTDENGKPSEPNACGLPIDPRGSRLHSKGRLPD